jgi:DNA replication initiation complex subunit (GINS family)
MSMNLRRDYERLYQHWLNEFQRTDLTELTQELFNYYKKSLDYINDYKGEGVDDLKDRILQSYRDNIKFLFNDFLKIREIKIINSALALKEINLNNVVEAEKLLYQNLVSSIKGYKKVKAFSLYEGEEEFKLEEAIELKVEMKESPVEPTFSTEEKSSIVSKSNIISDEEEFNYTLVRFLKKTPPLVGVDLINYGPFEKEDIANLPQKNVKILVIEKFAEEIELS